MNRADPWVAASAAKAPRLALVFGSGGVKSVAALGLAEVLAEAGLTPDLVVGCSAGAIFGALIAAGHDARAAQRLACSLWSRELTSQRRRRAMLDLGLAPVAQWLGRPDTGFAEHFALRDDRLINQRLHEAFGTAQLESLPIPLVVRATDAHTGEAVTLAHGPVHAALRASIALPFLFAPHPVAGRWLVDGSLCDPLPVGAAGHARTVLALGFEVPHPRAVTGPTRLATRITATLSNNLMHAQVAAHAGPGRITLLPRLPRRIGLFDTDAMPELIELGRQQARAALPRLLRALAASPGAGPPAEIRAGAAAATAAMPPALRPTGPMHPALARLPPPERA